jgi:hypothetical protein
MGVCFSSAEARDIRKKSGAIDEAMDHAKMEAERKLKLLLLGELRRRGLLPVIDTR